MRDQLAPRLSTGSSNSTVEAARVRHPAEHELRADGPDQLLLRGAQGSAVAALQAQRHASAVGLLGQLLRFNVGGDSRE